MRKQQSGFTLIELIMVIVILGILSAFALPKFADLSGNAEEAAIEGALASVKSASAIAHAQALVSSTVNGDITLEDQTITLVNSYPSADDADTGTICDAAGIDANSGFTCTDDDAAQATVTIALTGNANCSFTYQEAGVGGAPTISGINAACN